MRELITEKKCTLKWVETKNSWKRNLREEPANLLASIKLIKTHSELKSLEEEYLNALIRNQRFDH